LIESDEQLTLDYAKLIDFATPICLESLRAF